MLFFINFQKLIVYNIMCQTSDVTETVFARTYSYLKKKIFNGYPTEKKESIGYPACAIDQILWHKILQYLKFNRYVHSLINDRWQALGL